MVAPHCKLDYEKKSIWWKHLKIGCIPQGIGANPKKTCKFKEKDISVSVNNVARFSDSEGEKFLMTTYFVDKVIWHENFLHVIRYFAIWFKRQTKLTNNWF